MAEPDFYNVYKKDACIKMKAWFQRFMSGRYGGDQFNQFLAITSLVFLVLGLFLPGIFGTLFYAVGFAMLIYSYIRMFSRNHTKRIAENRWYWEKRNAVVSWFGGVKTRFAMRKTYHYYRCPRCRQQLRVPRGRGRISITCPKCGTSFIKKS